MTNIIDVPIASGIRLYDTGGKVSRFARRGTLYERPLLDRIKSLGLTGTAVDAGANVGNHTLWFAMVCHLKVIAFEPLFHELLRRNIDLNQMSDLVEVIPAALGAQPGTATHAGAGHLTLGFVVSGAPSAEDLASGQTVGAVEVRVGPLDNFELEDVSLMKLDVEGMETDVLHGAIRTIRSCRPVIYTEVWNNDAHDAIESILEPEGYRRTLRLDGKLAATPMEEWMPV
jgi:FkbM family methyltransferase